MKIVRRTDAAHTYFIFADVEPSFEQTLRDLSYQQFEDGYGRMYPTGTPGLDRIYHNFRHCAEEMLLQAAAVRPVPWQKALHAYLNIIEGHQIDWWLTGSAALSVRGIEVQPRDFDLVVDADGAKKLGELLIDFLYEPVLPVNDWICNWWGRAFLFARFEWAGEINESADQYGVTDFGLTAASRLETVNWHGHQIRVPPLDLQYQVSVSRGLSARSALIKQFLEDSG